MIELGSRRYFKAHFLAAALEAAADPVAGVRLRAAALLPPAKRALLLPDDVELLGRLHATVTALGGDAQPDVAAAARAASEAYMRTPVRSLSPARILSSCA